MKRLLLLPLLLVGGCSGCGNPEGNPDGGDGESGFAACDSDTQSWVRNAYLAVVGRRPHGQAEVDVYAALHDQIQALVDAESTTVDPKAVVVKAMTEESAYRARWTSHFMDALRVPRVDDQSMSTCYGESMRGEDSGELAAYVRDNPATAAGSGGQWSMRDLVESSVELDDVTPLYRAHLFALVNFPIPAANVLDVGPRELARREDFGLVFDSAYLNRDLVCLGCHNSQMSVTDDPDPTIDRHWPIAGRFEEAIYGAPDGIEHERAHAVFRHEGFASGMFGDPGPRRPWGWTTGCGSFYSSFGDDPAQIDGKFGDLTGRRLTVYDLEASLESGFEALRGGALTLAEDGTIADPDQAFAYLVAATIVEGVWKEVVGSGLTIANYFPRNEAARDLLKGLTDRFVASGYSLEDLLLAIVSSDFFSRTLPEEACGDGPYIYPNVYDPWVISDDDEARRLNGPGDAVAAVSARTLMRTAFEAMEWETPELDFPSGDGGFCTGLSCQDLEFACDQGFCCDTYEQQCLGGGDGGPDELAFQQGAGAFLKNGERGFRGLDFQARLVWEDRFGRCDNPGSTDDLVDQVVAAAGADSAATVADVIAAVKDRLIGEPLVDDAAEESALEAIYGGALSRRASEVTDLEAATRRLCGVLLSSPQFLLSGAAGRAGEVPRLTPADWRFGSVCERVAARITDVEVACDGDDLTVTAPEPTEP